MVSRNICFSARFNSRYLSGRPLQRAPNASRIIRHQFARPKNRKHPRRILLQSSLNSWLVIITAAGIFLSGSLYLYQASSTSINDDRPRGLKDPLDLSHYDMVASIPPGRPGNLTQEQETKLQDLWIAVLNVFGVEAPPDNTSDDVGKEANQQTREESIATDKKKKKRTGMFSRKRDEADKVQVDSSVESDDKYGQTKEFKQTLATQSPEDLREAFWSMLKHDHPDGLLLRFLRARKWDPQRALVMLISTIRWRLVEMRIEDDILRNGEAGAVADSMGSDKAVVKEGADFMTQIRRGKCYLRGTDKEGRPTCYVRTRLHRQGEQSEASLERFTVHILETARLLLAANVDTAAVVFDLTDFSMANMDYGPVKFMIKCFEANYPESLGVVLVHKSPWIFHGIWNIIKGWLDPVVASKVHFTKTIDELEAFIERSHIPQELGGDDPYTYQYVEPVPGENAATADKDTRQRLLDERAAMVMDFESITYAWIRAASSERDALWQKRNELVERLRTGYWQLDPYVRARTLYDRIGMIQPGGKIQFYDSPTNHNHNNNKTSFPAGAQNGPLPAGHRVNDLD